MCSLAASLPSLSARWIHLFPLSAFQLVQHLGSVCGGVRRPCRLLIERCTRLSLYFTLSLPPPLLHPFGSRILQTATSLLGAEEMSVYSVSAWASKMKISFLIFIFIFSPSTSAVCMRVATKKNSRFCLNTSLSTSPFAVTADLTAQQTGKVKLKKQVPGSVLWHQSLC